MVAVLDKSNDDISARKVLGETKARLPGDSVVEQAVQKPHRAEERDLRAHYEMPPAVFEQAERKSVTSQIVFRGQRDRAGFATLFPLRCVESRPEEILGKVGCGGDADERVDPLGSRERGKQHDPPAHARADENLLTLGQRIENGDRILDPAADSPQGEITARYAVSEIIEANIGQPAAPAIFLEKRGLGSSHVGAEAAEEYNARGPAGEPPVGDCCTIVTW